MPSSRAKTLRWGKALRFAAIALAVSIAPTTAQSPLRAGVDATFAPFSYPDPAGALQGFNIDLVKEVGKRLGRPIETVLAHSEDLAGLLQSGRIDVIAAPPITVTRQRATPMLFTEAYLNSDYQLVMRAERLPLRVLRELSGRTIAVVKGSPFEEWARSEATTAGWSVATFPGQVGATQAVLSGAAEATVTGSANAGWIVKQTPTLALSYRHATGLVWALPVRGDQHELRTSLDGAIECMKHDGTLASLHERWFGRKPEPGSAAGIIFPGAGVPGMPGYEADARTPPC